MDINPIYMLSTMLYYVPVFITLNVITIAAFCGMIYLIKAIPDIVFQYLNKKH